MSTSPNRFALFILLFALLLSSVWIRRAHAAQLSDQDVKLAEIDEQRQVNEEEEFIEEEDEQEEEEQGLLIQKPAETPAKKPIVLEVVRPAKKGIKTPAKKLLHNFHFHYSVLEGYDRNVKLNSAHKGSFVTDQFFTVNYTNHIQKILFYRLSYGLRSLNDYKFGDENLMDQHFQIQSSVKLHPKLFFEPEYKFNVYREPHDSVANFDQQRVKVGLKHFLYKDILFHKASYIYIHRGYDKFAARLPSDRDIPGPHHRRDNVNAFDYEIGLHPFKNLLFQVHNQFGRNESNDQFFNFYDYNYYQVSPLVIWQPAKKISFVAGFQYERNNYEDRAIRGTQDLENVSSIFGSVFYLFNSHAALGFHWLYTRNGSKLQELDYDNSIFSVGLHLQA